MNNIKPLMRIAIAIAAGLLTMLSAAPAHATGGVTRVAGLLEPDSAGVCSGDPGNVGAYVVSGTLSGCWYIDTFDNIRQNAGGALYADGTETFEGCLDDACGRLYTTFTFTAKYEGDSETHGRCHHPIVGGDGDFAGASGVINMHDLPNGCALYKGELSF